MGVCSGRAAGLKAAASEMRKNQTTAKIRTTTFMEKLTGHDDKC
jgi:hypothetical protein